MQDLEKALQQIGDIRSQIANSTEFQGFGPTAVATTSALALFTGVLQQLQPTENLNHYLLQWMVAATVCSVIVGAEMFTRTRHQHGQMAAALLIRALEQFLPAFACGAILTMFSFLVAPQTLWMLPGLWQLCVAMGLFAAARNLPATVKLVATYYFVCGFIVLVLGNGQSELSPWLMAVPFTTGQLMMALALRAGGDNKIQGEDRHG